MTWKNILNSLHSIFGVMRKPLLTSVGVTCILVLLILIAVPQETAILSVAVVALSFLFLLPIIVFGNPYFHLKFDHRYVWFAPIYTVIIPIVLLLFFTGEILLLEMIIIWYLFPCSILLLPKIIDDPRYKTVLYIIGASLLWIGFDHRYTTGIFGGFEDLGYTMNSFWMACIGFITYGIEEGIFDKQNENDRGLVPSVYALKVSNKITPIASLIIIPIGLLTSFLIWNPVKFEIDLIVISFIGIAFTIGLQEEMIFRGIILKELDKHGNSVNYKRITLNQLIYKEKLNLRM